jgi:hypothetical protein
LRLPQLAAAVEQLHLVAETVDVEHPRAPGGEPVVVVAVEDDRRVFGDAGIAQRLLERLARGDVALDRIDELGVPVEMDGARNVAALVDAGVFDACRYLDPLGGEADRYRRRPRPTGRRRKRRR